MSHGRPDSAQVGEFGADPMSRQPGGVEEAVGGEVTLVVRCDERAYRDTLSLGFTAWVARQFGREFAQAVVLIGDVRDPGDAHARAQALVDAGAITGFAVEASDASGADIGGLIARLVATPWVLGWRAGVTAEQPTQPVDWVGDGVALLTAHPWIGHVTLRRESPPDSTPTEADSVGTVGDYVLDWGFSDEVFLARRADVTRVRAGFAPAALARLGCASTFEIQVERNQRARGLARATLTTVAFRGASITGSKSEGAQRATEPLRRAIAAAASTSARRAPRWLGARFAEFGALPAPTASGMPLGDGHGIPRLAEPDRSTTVTISLLHATYHREGGPLPVRDTWLARADRPETVEYVVALDDDDALALEQTGGCLRAVGRQTRSVSAVRNWNAAAEVSSGSILVVIADDLLPREGWDTGLREVVGGLDPQQDDFAIKVSDSAGGSDLLLRHPIVSRGYYRKFGLFSCAFTGVYCDDDLTRRAWWRSVILDGRQVRVDHEHPPTEDIPALSVSQRRVNASEEYRVGYQRFCARWPKPLQRAKVRVIGPHQVKSDELRRHRVTFRALGVLDGLAWAAQGTWRRVSERGRGRRP